MKAELLIWDWNGTILDDTEACCGIAIKMLKERGIKPLEGIDAYREVFGFPIKDYYARMGYSFEVESYEEVSDEFIALYEDAYKRCPIRSGVIETLDAVKALGIPQVLLSATKYDQLIDQVAHFGDVGDRFEEKLGLPDHYAFSKAQLAKDFIEKKGVDPQRALFIGDTNHDYEVSAAIGCPCALLLNGHQSRRKLQETGALVLDSPKELLKYIEH